MAFYWASRFEQTYFPVRCDFSGRICVVGLRYAIAEVIGCHLAYRLSTDSIVICADLLGTGFDLICKNTETSQGFLTAGLPGSGCIVGPDLSHAMLNSYPDMAFA